MGVQYILINLDKHEKIGFYGLDCGTKHSEILSNPIVTAIISHYLLINSGDKIAFIDDTHFEFSLFNEIYPADYFQHFEEKTNAIIDDLIAKNIFQENGKRFLDNNTNNFVRNIALIP